MIEFKTNKIILDSDEMAGELKRTREEKKITLQKAARELKIGRNYLEHIEAGEFDRLPEGIYRKKIFQEDADYLGVNYKGFLKELNTLSRQTDKSQLFSYQRVKSRYLLFPKIIKNLAIALVFLACLFYLGSRVKEIFAPPELVIDNPKDNLVTEDNSIAVIGTTEPEAEVSVNGELILINENGFFQKEIYLKDGVNTITITAKKKHSRNNTATRQVLKK